jgi:hypothetical protein
MIKNAYRSIGQLIVRVSKRSRRPFDSTTTMNVHIKAKPVAINHLA